MIKISRESEVNLINVLIDQDVISGKDLPNIKKLSSEGEKTQLEAVFDLNLTDEHKILDLLVNMVFVFVGLIIISRHIKLKLLFLISAPGRRPLSIRI